MFGPMIKSLGNESACVLDDRGVWFDEEFHHSKDFSLYTQQLCLLMPRTQRCSFNAES